MTRRIRWLWAAVGASLLLLLLGRWLAVATTHRLWAEALGVGQAHADITRFRSLLFGSVFGIALAWCAANLYVVYRAVASVSVARHVGNLEFVEAVPRRYLQLIASGVAVVLAAVLSRHSGDWWSLRALAATTAAESITDPILHRDVAYYLFQLPWQRQLHAFATLGVTVMLGVVTALYVAIGALRWAARRLHVQPAARVHLAGLLGVLALVLFWGYRLEPAEYVGGIREVAIDPILTEVRLPTARLLGLLALVALAGSITWVWLSRIAIVAAPWLVLGLASLLGHHVLPAFASTVRQDARSAVGVAEAQPAFTALAYGMNVLDTVLELSPAPHPSQLRTHMAALGRAPIWDGFAARAYVNRVMADAPFAPFLPVRLDVYEGRDRAAVPLYVGVRTFDFSGPRSPARDLSWGDVHVGPYASPRGVVALDPVGSAPDGTPRFLTRIEAPDSSVADAVELPLRDGSLVFGPGNTDFAVVQGASAAAQFGVPVENWWRRLAFAWTFQSARLATGRAGVAPTLVWHRDVVRRLERYAPFARFGEALPVVATGSLYWVAPGYVSAEAFPLSQRASWRGEGVGYLRAGFIGVVEAQSGKTAVYLAREPDALSRTWAGLLPGVVQRHDAIPRTLGEHARYPQELFLQHSALLQQHLVPGGQPAAGRRFVPRRWLSADDDLEAFWWFGPGVRDSVPRLRIRMAVEVGDPARLAAVLEGTMQDGVPRLEVLRFPEEAPLPGPSQLLPRFAQARLSKTSVPGLLRAVPTRDGMLYVQAAYRETEDETGAPALVDVVVGWGTTVERGSSLPSALERIASAQPSTIVSAGQWHQARQWFERMDAARQSGDWTAFGTAYEALRRILANPEDAVP